MSSISLDVGKSKLQRKPKTRPRFGPFQIARLRLGGWNGVGTWIANVPMGEQGAVRAMVFGNFFMRIATDTYATFRMEKYAQAFYVQECRFEP